jgi:hypothetical protein
MDYEIITSTTYTDISRQFTLFNKPKYTDLINPLVFNYEHLLYVKNTSISFDYKLFKQYNKICFENQTNIIIKDFPDNITHLICDNESSIIVNLPIKLVYLSLTYKSYREDLSEEQIKLLKHSKNILHNLPNSLKYLAAEFTLDSNNIPLNNLPPGLEYFIAYCKDYEYEFNNLSINLQCLQISGNYNKLINNLPIGLKYLEILGPWFAQSLDTMPYTIKYLLLSNTSISVINNLSIDLEELNIKDHSIIKNIKKLPIKLHKLYLNKNCTEGTYNYEILNEILIHNPQLSIYRAIKNKLQKYKNNTWNSTNN